MSPAVIKLLLGLLFVAGGVFSVFRRTQLVRVRIAENEVVGIRDTPVWRAFYGETVLISAVFMILVGLGFIVFGLGDLFRDDTPGSPAPFSLTATHIADGYSIEYPHGWTRCDEPSRKGREREGREPKRIVHLEGDDMRISLHDPIDAAPGRTLRHHLRARRGETDLLAAENVRTQKRFLPGAVSSYLIRSDPSVAPGFDPFHLWTVFATDETERIFRIDFGVDLGAPSVEFAEEGPLAIARATGEEILASIRFDPKLVGEPALGPCR
jgi:hypothetical protein